MSNQIKKKALLLIASLKQKAVFFLLSFLIIIIAIVGAIFYFYIINPGENPPTDNNAEIDETLYQTILERLNSRPANLQRGTEQKYRDVF